MYIDICSIDAVAAAAEFADGFAFFYVLPADMIVQSMSGDIFFMHRVQYCFRLKIILYPYIHRSVFDSVVCSVVTAAFTVDVTVRMSKVNIHTFL